MPEEAIIQRVALRTERLLLRPFTKDDVEEALIYRNDEEFARFLPHIPQPFTQADAEKFVETNMTEPWDQYPTFAIEFEGKLIGTVNLEIDVDQQIAMIGYAISRAEWGKGIAPEAARAAIAWGFETFGLVKIWASTDAQHTRSRRVLEKLNMQHEGTLRRQAKGRNGGHSDVVMYGLLREEWAAAATTTPSYSITSQ